MLDSVYLLPAGITVLAFMNPAGAFLIKYVPPKVLITVGAAIGVASALLAARANTFI